MKSYREEAERVWNEANREDWLQEEGGPRGVIATALRAAYRAGIAAMRDATIEAFGLSVWATETVKEEAARLLDRR